MIPSFSIILFSFLCLFTFFFFRVRRNDNVQCEQPTDSASPELQLVPDSVESSLEESSHLELEHSQPAGEAQLSVRNY